MDGWINERMDGDDGLESNPLNSLESIKLKTKESSNRQQVKFKPEDAFVKPPCSHYFKIKEPELPTSLTCLLCINTQLNSHLTPAHLNPVQESKKSRPSSIASHLSLKAHVSNFMPHSS